MTDLFARWILTAVIFVPLIGVVMIGLMNARSHALIRRGALLASFATLGFALAALRLYYEPTNAYGEPHWRAGLFALSLRVPWIGDPQLLAGVDVAYAVGVDGISIWLLVMTAALTPLAIWASFSGIRERIKEYYLLLLLLEAGMLGVFCARDLLLFYVFFEFTLIPLFFLIGIWGGPQRRRAASKFFIYTLAGSVLTFTAILFLAYQAYRMPGIGVFTFDIEKLYAVGERLDLATQRWLFVAMAAGFAIRVPLFPFHTWLPLVHTEAPMAGSVLLAAVLLKLGAYGFLRLIIPMLPAAAIEFAPLVAGLAVVGILYGALAAWVQGDMKKLVAYSSVSHLGFCMLGMFSLKVAGLTGALAHMINHGLSTAALFLIVGVIYERYHTRRFDEIGGLAFHMPWLAFFLVFFSLSSIGLPGLNGFVGIFLVLVGAFTSSSTLDGNSTGPLGIAYAMIAAAGVILSAVYMLWMCQRVLFGPLRELTRTPDRSSGLTTDLTPREIAILTPLAVAALAIGVYPKPLIESMQPALQEQVIAHVLNRAPDWPVTPVIPFAAAAPTHAAVPSDGHDASDSSERRPEASAAHRTLAPLQAVPARAETAGSTASDVGGGV